MQIKPLNRQVPGLAHRGRCTAVVSAITVSFSLQAWLQRRRKMARPTPPSFMPTAQALPSAMARGPMSTTVRAVSALGRVDQLGGTMVRNSWEGEGPPKALKPHSEPYPVAR